MRTDVIRSETLRYLGCGSEIPDEKTLEMVDKAIALLQEKVRPKNVYKIIEIVPDAEGIKLPGGYRNGETVKFISESLGRVMSGCTRMIVFGATLGAEADMLIKRAAAGNIAMGAVM